MLKLVVYVALLGLIGSLSYAQKDLNQLLKQMTNEEKCGQMTQVTFQVIQKDNRPSYDEVPIDEDRLRTAILNKNVGSILNTPYDIAAKASIWIQMNKLIQDVSAQTRLKIPVIYGIDSIHGANYIQESVLFPQPLSMAASFNLEISEKVGSITALETRSVGIPWNFNPVLDIGRQPLWPRLYETYGEDVYLAAHMGAAYIKGNQGNDLKDKKKVVTCLKHYIGYSYPFNGRDRTVAWIPEIMLREYFLPSFEAGVKAGSLTVMVNSGDVNGVPGHANSFYINDILKGELGFEGFVVSDWEDIVRLYTRDKVAETPEDAVRIAVMAGLDMSMVPYDFSFYDHCVNLTKKDSKFTARVDDAVMRILKVKQKLGLFENPYPNQQDLSNIGTDASENFNLEAARESIILAKNENNLLPISKSSRVLVAGPGGNILRVLNGGWSYTWQGNIEKLYEDFGRKKLTMFNSVKTKAVNTVFSEGANFTHTTNLDATVNEARNSDVIVLCIGEDAYTETPGNINSLILSDSQQTLANALIAVGKPIIVVYLGGRPRIITNIAEKSRAVILGFLPGNRGAEAIADIIFGDYNPNGRLPITYPLSPNGIVPYDLKPLEAADGNKYENLFPFGHGLSYTTFEYSNLVFNSTIVAPPNGLSVLVNVKNTGSIAGKEAVILYLHDEIGSVSRPLKQVKGFQKVSLNAGETKTVRFDVSLHDMSFIGQDMKRTVEAGHFNIYIGNLAKKFELIQDSSFSASNSLFKFSIFNTILLLLVYICIC